MNMYLPEPYTSWAEYDRAQGRPSREDLQEWRETNFERSYAHQEFLMEHVDQPAARAALQPILKAGKLSRFRVLRIVCPKNHTIAEVYRTAGGLVLLGVGPLVIGEAHAAGGVIEGHYDPDFGPVGDHEWSYDWQQTRRTNREQRVVCFLHSLWAEPGGCAVATMQCRCTTARLGRPDIEQYMATGKRRVVHDKSAQRT